MMKEI